MPEHVTPEDVQGLRDETGRLADSIDSLRGQQEHTAAQVQAKASKQLVAKLEQNIRGARRRNIAIALVVFALVVVVVVVSWAFKHQHDEDQAKTQQARVGSCIQFNVNQKAQRDAIVTGIGDALDKLLPADPRSQAFVAQFRTEAAVTVAAQLPYRDCSPAGIAEFLQHPPADPNAGG